jgi:hypothetical protein
MPVGNLGIQTLLLAIPQIGVAVIVGVSREDFFGKVLCTMPQALEIPRAPSLVPFFLNIITFLVDPPHPSPLPPPGCFDREDSVLQTRRFGNGERSLCWERGRISGIFLYPLSPNGGEG